jgi:NAD(P)-dependent dehydrogenase (short-subunit alcohol dehydrogenase family)
MDMQMDGKVVVITGGASGIGAACAKLFQSEGAQIVIVDRAAPMAEIRTDNYMVLVGDVGDEETVKSQIKKIFVQHKRIDGLVNCAGFSNGKSVLNTSLEDWESVLKTNLTGTFLWSRETAIAMRTSVGGSIVMIGSQLSFAGGRSNAAYLASKGAVVSLARTLAVEHAPDNIRVNVLIPGAIDTPLLSRSFSRSDDPAAAKERSVARHPIGRLGQPVEIARAALFLISPTSSFTTGSCLMADGGWLAG